MKVEVKRKNKRGKMIFEFREVDESDIGTQHICKQICPYGCLGLDICNKLPNPRYGPKDNNKFSDFCVEIGLENGFGDFVPTSGSLEKYYGRLIEKIKLRK